VSQLTSLARLLAVETGRAQPTKTVRHVHLSDRPLVLVAAQLAGEACAPLAALVGDDRARPRLLVVYEPRDRTQRFAWAAALAETVLGYIDGYVKDIPDQDPDPEAGPGTDLATGLATGTAKPEPAADAPQLLVPNPQTAGFLRLLGRSTRFRSTTGEHAVPEAVPLLGRWLTYYSERTEVTPSALLLPLTAVLADHWASGQSATEDALLGALLGWIDPPPGLSGPQAARVAEDPVRCPPAGPVTDPGWDNDVLEPMIAAVRAATATGDAAALARAQTAMDGALRSQLQPTWDLTWQGIDLLRELPEAAHVPARWVDDRKSFTSTVTWIRQGGAPQPRRDSAVSAARRLARLEREQQRLAVERAFDDPLVLAGYRLTGEAFAGRVTWRELDRLDESRSRAVPRPLITLATEDEVIMDEGTVLKSPARPSQKAVLKEILSPESPGGTTYVTLELTSGMGRGRVPQPGSIPEFGEELTYTSLSYDFQPPAKFPAREDTPWTHGGPPEEYVPTDDDAREDWS
jgi:hypothetical protein